MELILFNNLYTQDQFFNGEWEPVSQSPRSSFYTGIFEGLYGIGDRVNIGFDAFYGSVHIGNAPLETLTFDKSTNAHHALTGILPKVKVAPFENGQALTIETGVLIPVANDPEAKNHDRPFLANDDIQWQTEIFYVKDLSSQFQLFSELDAFWRIDEAGAFSEASSLRTPASIFLSWFPADRWSLYGMGEFNPTWGGDGLSSAFYQNGVGIKYQITSSLEIEGLYTNFLAGKNQGAGQTFNLGFRFQRNDFY